MPRRFLAGALLDLNKIEAPEPGLPDDLLKVLDELDDVNSEVVFGD